jgi:hypothetical protein
MKINLLKSNNDHKVSTTKSLLMPAALTFGGSAEKI